MKEERVTAVYNTKTLARFFVKESNNIIKIHKTWTKSDSITEFLWSVTHSKQSHQKCINGEWSLSYHMRWHQNNISREYWCGKELSYSPPLAYVHYVSRKLTLMTTWCVPSPQKDLKKKTERISKIVFSYHQ